jgi:hypothetical protein
MPEIDATEDEAKAKRKLFLAGCIEDGYKKLIQ